MSLPLIKNYKQVYYVERENKTLRNLVETLNEIKNNKSVLYYLLGFFPL